MDTILGPLYIAVSWIIVQFHSFYSLIFDKNSGAAWGLSIVSLVVLIRICLIPLFVKQIKSTRNMQALQPKMKAIQERYKNDKQRQSEEMMKLYKETGTNPLSSCLPILAQSPFFISLYQVLSHIAQNKTVGVIDQPLLESAQKAHIFGAPLAAKFMDSAEKIQSLGASVVDVRVVTIIMIVLMSASQFYTQRQLMTKNVDLTVKTPFMQQQKMLMYVFPVMFAVFGINFPVGVLVYWLTTNVWTMGQQMFVIRRNPTPGSKAFAERQERLRAAGKIVEDPAVVEAKQAAEEARQNRQQPKRQTKSKRQTGGAAPVGGAQKPYACRIRFGWYGRRTGCCEEAVAGEEGRAGGQGEGRRLRVPHHQVRSAQGPAAPQAPVQEVRRSPFVTDTTPATKGTDTLTRLEQEGEIAADYLEGLLDIADLDGDIDMDVEADRAAVSIISDSTSRDLQKLVGRDGEVLEALQELTRLAVHRETGDRSRLMLDIAGFRARKREELAEIGAKAAEEVKGTGEPVKLDPMTPFERKVVHDAVAAAGLRSESEGEEPQRRVVVLPA